MNNQYVPSPSRRSSSWRWMRFLALAFVLIHLIAITPLKAEAAVISDVSDYVVRKYIQDGVTYVEVEYDLGGGPPEDLSVTVYACDLYGITEYFNRDYVELVASPEGPNWVSFQYKFFDISDIPEGAILDIEFISVVEGIHPWYDLTSDFVVEYYDEFYDSYGTQSSSDLGVITQSTTGGIDYNLCNFSVQLKKVTDLCGLNFSIRGFRDGEAGESDFMIHTYPRSLTFTFSYDSLLDLAEGQDKTNQLLELLQSGSQNMHDNANAADKEMSNSSDRLDSLGDTLSGVNKPSLDSSAGNIDNFLAGGFGPAANVLTIVTENKTIGTMLMLVGTLALVSYVFFGKRR